MKYTPVQIFGGTLIALGTIGICGLVFFYGVVLFSDAWPLFKDAYDAFRVIFSIPSGLVVMYASFIALCIPFLLATIFGSQLCTQKRYISHTQLVLLLLVWFVAVLFGFFTMILQVQQMITRLTPFSDDPVAFDVSEQIPLSVQYVFKTTLKNEVQRTAGVPIEGYEPEMFMAAFSGLTPTDFAGVEASIGQYVIEDGKLVHKMDDTRLIHSAAKAITDRGLDTLLENVSVRLGVDLTTDGTLTEIMDALVTSSGSPSSDEVSIPETSNDVIPPTGGVSGYNDGGGAIACTMDAKICLDGSAVGRQGPHCEFASCPGSATESTHICTPQEKQNQACTREYQPVCGLVSIQCITTPCNPIPETFSNNCTACAQGNVISYTQGACSI